MTAEIRDELTVLVRNEPGALARALRAAAEAGVNLLGFCGFVTWGEEGRVLLVPEHPAKALAALKKAGFNVESHPVVVVRTEDAVGRGAELAEKIASKGTNVYYSYATAAGGGTALVVFRTNDNGAAIAALR